MVAEKTSDNIENKGGEGSKDAANGKIDLNKYVPKDEVDKLTTTHASELEKLKGELDAAKLSLLDPEYIAYQAEKKNKKPNPEATIASAKDLEEMTSKELADHVAKTTAAQLKAEVIDPLKTELDKTKHSLSDVMAVIELQECAKKHSDFDAYRDDVKSIIENSTTDLTFEQAYLIAKANRLEADPEATIKAIKESKPGPEKPGGPKAPENEHKDYEDAEEAGNAAWDKAVGAGKDTL